MGYTFTWYWPAGDSASAGERAFLSEVRGQDAAGRGFI